VKRLQSFSEESLWPERFPEPVAADVTVHVNGFNITYLENHVNGYIVHVHDLFLPRCILKPEYAKM